MTEGPYKLPEGWRWVKLEEIASDIQSGFAFRKKGAETGEILHIRPYNIGSDGELKLDQQFRIPSTALPEHWSYLYPGDVLFNNTNSVELVGKTALVRTELQAAFSNHITRIRVSLNQCKGEWLALVLGALWQQGFFAQRCNKWIGQAGYNTEMLRRTPIPLPPLEEQRRIVARIEELMERIREARHLRQKAREDTERLWQATLADLFPRPGTALPSGWRWVKLEEVCEHQNGVWGNQDPKGYPVLRSKNFTDEGILTFEEVAYIKLTEQQVTKSKLHKGDILLERSGGGPNKPVGRVCIFTETPTNEIYCFGNFITVLRPSSVNLDAWYIFNYLRWAYISGMTEQLQTQTTNIRNLRFKEYMNQPIPLPSLEEQRRIVAHLGEVEEKVQSLKEGQVQVEAELQRLEQSILNAAFRGDL